MENDKVQNDKVQPDNEISSEDLDKVAGGIFDRWGKFKGERCPKNPLNPLKTSTPVRGESTDQR